ncbi:alpha/beta hydrolase family protein [Actinomadura atramentaria]|uniref:alpha/beta hydrolase family protein n=1 Tax=Actinomadura atramentaria TaxID=1990 RepID=UPI0003815083|nr:hypothetical protein [Actinomadura atramentaria]
MRFRTARSLPGGLLAAALTASVTLGLTAPPRPADAAPQPARRGTVVSAERVQNLSAGKVRTALADDGIDASRVRYGVTAYRIVYRTIDVAGRPTTASGLLVLPRDGERNRLRVVAYTHGTMATRSAAPSVDDGGRSDEGLLFASAGYAAVEPDYLGLGVGPGRHPYMHAASETTATLDMLRASFAFARRPLDPRVLMTGFSQGGQAAMAVGKALRAGADPRFRLAAAAPVSGPYALRDAEIPAIFDGTLDPRTSAFYLAYFFVAWNRLYHLYDRPTEIFQAPYARTVESLFDGSHGEEDIVMGLPGSPEELLTPHGLDMLRHPTGRLAAALAVNDATCAGWTRGARVRIFAARGDEQVAFTNAERCRADLAAAGVRAPLIDLGDLQHNDSGRRGLVAALAWFQRIARP